MAAQLCPVCEDMFREQVLQQSRPHHQSTEDILATAGDGCRFCKIITQSRGFEHFGPGKEKFEATWYLVHLENISTEGSDWFRLTIDAAGPEDEDEEEEREESERGEDGPENSQSAQPSLEVDEHGHVRVPESGEGAKTHAPRLSPPLWGFTMIPTTSFQKGAGYKPPSGTDDPRMWSLAQSWLDSCVANHPKCRPRNPDYQPTRLVQILDEKAVRVVLREDRSNPPEPYASFSHCWGQTKTLKLLKGNMARLRTRVDIADLPRSYIEALGVASRLGIRFIWIDSLCIIQDSKEDWRAEAATMKGVYGSAVLNISASAAAQNAESSFRRRDPLTIEPLCISPLWDQRQYLLGVMDSYKDEIEYSPLRSRSWVTQEAFLSGRNLSLTDSQLWWECRERLKCEAWPDGWPRPIVYNASKKADDTSDVAANHVIWCDLVEKYTACGLTVLSDKLIAMAGLANHFRRCLAGNDEYVAGMWRSQLPQALCWVPDNFAVTYRTAQYRAPSWSWASVEGSIAFFHRSLGDGSHSVAAACDVVDVRVVPAGTDVTGDLVGGYLRLRGRLTPVGVRDGFLGMLNSEGEYDYFEGSDGNRDPSCDDETNQTNVVLDEMASDEEPMVSHLETAAIDVLQGGSLAKTARRTTLLDDWEGEFFCLPVIEWFRRGEPRVRGLLLGHAVGEPPGIYQRVGSWSGFGAITAPLFSKGKMQEFVIV